MKAKLIILTTLAIFFIFESCIPSLHPIYSTDKLVEVKELPGTWVDEASMTEDGTRKKVLEHQENFELTTTDKNGRPETWQFNKQDGKSYLLIHTDGEGNPGAFEVHIVQLGKHLFMDFYPTDLPGEKKELFDITNSPEANSMMAWHLLPVHTFAKLEVGKDKLKISMFDPEFLEKLLKNRQIRIKHEEVNGGFVLTAPTADLQKFAEKYAEMDEAFLPEPVELKIKI